jgi:hypothetical protein
MKKNIFLTEIRWDLVGFGQGSEVGIAELHWQIPRLELAGLGWIGMMLRGLGGRIRTSKGKRSYLWSGQDFCQPEAASFPFSYSLFSLHLPLPLLHGCQMLKGHTFR